MSQSKESAIWTDTDLRVVLEDITLQNTVLNFKWRFKFTPTAFYALDPELSGEQGRRTGWRLWVSFERPDTITGIVSRGRGREEIVYQGATVSAVVKTCWLLIELMVRHELMEAYRFRGDRIFNPHNSVLDLVELQREHDERQLP